MEPFRKIQCEAEPVVEVGYAPNRAPEIGRTQGAQVILAGVMDAISIRATRLQGRFADTHRPQPATVRASKPFPSAHRSGITTTHE